MANDLILLAAALLGLAIVAGTALHGWQGWLRLKTRELDRQCTRLERGGTEGGALDGSARIELADLKERVRNLEAIAAGVDL